MSSKKSNKRLEFPLAGGGTLFLVGDEKSLFEEITKDLLEKAERILGLMKKHVKDDFANEKFRRIWAAPPIPGREGDLLSALLWVIGHERESMFAMMTKHSAKSANKEATP